MKIMSNMIKHLINNGENFRVNRCTIFTKPIASSVFYLWYSRYPVKYSIGMSITLKVLVLF